jgi:ubiquinone/menaquinone biosynthesis C-methylase UbiE
LTARRVSASLIALPGVPKTTKDWRAAARIDPLWAVASWPGKRGAWSPDEFYALGESDWQDVLHHWRHYEPQLGGTCVDVGCGAGRMTRQIAGTFAEVIGIDVSAEMIQLAAEACPDNVRFHQVDGPVLPLESASVDAVFTVHVLQHLEGPSTVRAYLREIARVLVPGGTAMIHCLLSSEPSSGLRRTASRAQLALARRRMHRGADVVAYQSSYYRPEDFRQFLDDSGFRDVELRVFAMRSNGDPHPFWLVRRLPD